MPVHDVAQRGFDSGAAAYEQARPSYPPDAVAWLVEHLRIGPGRARAATSRPAPASSPRSSPRAAPDLARGRAGRGDAASSCSASLPGVPRSPAPPRPCPSRDAALDAVTVAQAFHWFDADRGARRARPRRCAPAAARAHLERARSIGRLGRRAVVDHGPRREARAVAGPRALVRLRARRPPRLRTARRGRVPPRAAARRRRASLDRFRVGQPRRGAPRRRAAPRCSTRSARCSTTHPDTRRPHRGRDPLPRRRLLVRAGGVSASAHRVALTAGRAAGWLSRATGRGQGATISGRVMNAIAPDLARASSRPTNTSRSSRRRTARRPRRASSPLRSAPTAARS